VAVVCLQLVLGNYGLSVDQQRYQLSLWSMMSAPLFISSDLRTMGVQSLRMLLNAAVLSVDQDPLGKLALEIQKVCRQSQLDNR